MVWFGIVCMYVLEWNGLDWTGLEWNGMEWMYGEECFTRVNEHVCCIVSCQGQASFQTCRSTSNHLAGVAFASRNCLPHELITAMGGHPIGIQCVHFM